MRLTLSPLPGQDIVAPFSALPGAVGVVSPATAPNRGLEDFQHHPPTEDDPPLPYKFVRELPIWGTS